MTNAQNKTETINQMDVDLSQLFDFILYFNRENGTRDPFERNACLSANLA